MYCVLSIRNEISRTCCHFSFYFSMTMKDNTFQGNVKRKRQLIIGKHNHVITKSTLTRENNL
jgi:hypothetical protein